MSNSLSRDTVAHKSPSLIVALIATLALPFIAGPAAARSAATTTRSTRSTVTAPSDKSTSTAASKDVRLARFVFANKVEARKPHGVAQRFDIDGQRVYAYIEVANKGPRQKLTMTWKRGRTTFRYKLTVGKSPTWRTWSYLRASKHTRGTWTVTVTDQSGALLGKKTVVVGEARAAKAPERVVGC